MKTQLAIRKSGYGDYIAIDLIDEKTNILETPLYLKKGEVKKCKIKWDWKEWNGQTEIECMEMISGEIKFDGKNILATYLNTQSGIYWWEPTEFELTIGTVFHFKDSVHSENQPL